NFRIMKVVNGNYTQVGTPGTISGTGTGTLRLEVFGNSQKLFFDDGVNGSRLVAFANDTSTTAGSVGLRATNAAKFDNFTADSISASPQSLPYGPEDFSTATRNQLGTQWSETTGNFKVDTVNGKLTNNASAM